MTGAFIPDNTYLSKVTLNMVACLGVCGRAGSSTIDLRLRLACRVRTRHYCPRPSFDTLEEAQCDLVLCCAQNKQSLKKMDLS